MKSVVDVRFICGESLGCTRIEGAALYVCNSLELQSFLSNSNALEGWSELTRAGEHPSHQAGGFEAGEGYMRGGCIL